MSQFIRWIEVWVDSGTYGEFFLILRAMHDGSYVVVNPHHNNQSVMHFHSYEDAESWLREDEYELVEGRWSNE